jgi:membrane-associated protease RseP (regulator of RpoE activity)
MITMFSANRFYLGHLGKTPVYVSTDAIFNLLLIWMWCDKTLPGFLIMLMAFITVILTHECGHALVARLVGMQGIAITISAFGGYCSYAGDRRPRTDLPISLAGPGANFLTAGLIWLFVLYVYPFARMDPMVAKFVSEVMVWSLVLGIFNALPIYPLDGGQATLALSRMATGREATAKYFTLVLTVIAGLGSLIGLAYFNLGPSIFTLVIMGLLMMAAFRDLR